jgi:hypothetical protein
VTVFVHLGEKTIVSHDFGDPNPFTSVRIVDESRNDVTLAVNADSAAIALQLADALRAAALKHMPQTQDAVVAVEV